MAGLRQVLAVRGDDVLPYLVPKLVSPQPLSAFQLRALANVAEVTGDKIYTHFNLILPPVLDVLAGSHAKGDSSDAAVAARLSGPEGASARTLVTSVRGPGVQWLVVELCQAISEGSATRRWVAASLLEAFVSAASTDFSDQVPIMLKDLIYKLVVDDHEQSLLAVSAALRSLVAAVGVESLQERMGFMRDCLRSAASEGKLFVKPKVGSAAAGAAGGAASGGAKSAAAAEYVVPGLCVPKGLDAFFPVYQQGLVRGAPHVRELAATAVGELVSLTSTKALRPYFMKLTGPLIRVVADKYSAEVKAAILNTLNIIIAKGGDVLRDGLGRVMSLSKRVDPIVNEVLNNIGTTIGGVKESMTAALKEVLQHAGSKLTPTMRTKAVSALLPLLVDGDDIVRSIAAAGTGAFLTHLTVEEAMPIVMFITNEDGSASDIAASSAASGSGASGFALGLGGVDMSSAGTDSSWLALHGRLMALRAVCKYCASDGPGLDSLPALGGAPSAALLAAGANPGGKPQVRVATAAAASWVLRRACTGAAQGWGAVCGAAHSALAALVADPSKDVKAAAFVSLKLACKVPEVGMHNSPAVASIVQGLAAGVKEKAAVKLAAEQAAYHFLNIQEQGATGLLDGIEDKVDQEAATALKLYAGRVLVKLSLDEDDADEDEDYAGY
ncbi:ILA [Symbiodinium sp. KB8]|nr:ILA [Symbiodinium sp. KB8]